MKNVQRVDIERFKSDPEGILDLSLDGAVVIHRADRPEAVLISYETYKQYTFWDEESDAAGTERDDGQTAAEQLAVIAELTDERALSDYLLNGCEPEVAEKIVKRLSDPVIITDLICSDIPEGVKSQLIRTKPLNQDGLVDLVRNNPSPMVRIAAIQRLNHSKYQSLLKEIISADPDRKVREEAVVFIRDQQFLAELACSESQIEVCNAAVNNKHLSDTDLLRSISSRAEHPWIRNRVAAILRHSGS